MIDTESGSLVHQNASGREGPLPVTQLPGRGSREPDLAPSEDMDREDGTEPMGPKAPSTSRNLRLPPMSGSSQPGASGPLGHATLGPAAFGRVVCMSRPDSDSRALSITLYDGMTGSIIQSGRVTPSHGFFDPQLESVFLTASTASHALLLTDTRRRLGQGPALLDDEVLVLDTLSLKEVSRNPLGAPALFMRKGNDEGLVFVAEAGDSGAVRALLLEPDSGRLVQLACVRAPYLKDLLYMGAAGTRLWCFGSESRYPVALEELTIRWKTGQDSQPEASKANGVVAWLNNLGNLVPIPAGSALNVFRGK